MARYSLHAMLQWLRAGYPEGVPEQDYVPLFALLRRRLTDDEVTLVADALVDDGSLPIEKIDIGVLITRVTNDMPLETDIDRVRRLLEAGGWPLAGSDQ